MRLPTFKEHAALTFATVLASALWAALPPKTIMINADDPDILPILAPPKMVHHDAGGTSGTITYTTNGVGSTCYQSIPGGIGATGTVIVTPCGYTTRGGDQK